MAGADTRYDPSKALAFKEQGNKCFQAGDFAGAEGLYTKGIHYDPGNPILYTNRAMSLLSLSKNAAAAQSPSTNMPLSPIHVENYEQVIADCLTSIRLVAENMKAYYFLAQAQIALHQCSSAVSSAKEAHRLCVEDVHKGGKGASSIGPITELVLRCKKEEWEVREKERLQRRNGLVGELEGLLQNEREARFKDLEHKAAMGLLDAEKFEGESKKLEDEFEKKVDDVRRMALAAGIAGEDAKKRTVPDWCLDDITFSVMVDPVVTKTGQSYDRSSIMEHLKRSKTDPLTREPLRVEDLRPNLALKEACAGFLEENGWAVDW